MQIRSTQIKRSTPGSRDGAVKEAEESALCQDASFALRKVSKRRFTLEIRNIISPLWRFSLLLFFFPLPSETIFKRILKSFPPPRLVASTRREPRVGAGALAACVGVPMRKVEQRGTLKTAAPPATHPGPHRHPPRPSSPPTPGFEAKGKKPLAKQLQCKSY